MTLDTILYSEYEQDLPQNGRHILCQERGENLIVYQAFNPHISEFAVRHQRFWGKILKQFATDWIVSIEDITPFVKEQKALLDAKRTNELRVIKETVFSIDNTRIIQKPELNQLAH